MAKNSVVRVYVHRFRDGKYLGGKSLAVKTAGGSFIYQNIKEMLLQAGYSIIGNRKVAR